MLSKHRIGFGLVLVVVLLLASTVLVAAQSDANVYLPVVSTEGQAQQPVLDDRSDELDLAALDSDVVLGSSGRQPSYNRAIAEYAVQSLKEGRQTFRFDTFGSEHFWGDALRLHEAI